MPARPDDPRLAAPPPRAVDWVVRCLGGRRAVSVLALKGGVSHANHLIHVEGGRPPEAVLRRWVSPALFETDPEFSPAQEIATYRLLERHGVPAPALLDADPTPDHCDVPALLLRRAPGRRTLRPGDRGAFADRLAEVLAAIHAVDAGDAARTVPPYRPFYEPDRHVVPDWTRRPDVWRLANELARAVPPASPDGFIHRDFHPGNTLWRNGHLTAVVDWTSAEFGPREVDLAHMRVNLALSFSIDVADAFLAAYLGRRPGRGYDPRWDVFEAADCVPEWPTGSWPAAGLLRLEALVARAIDGRR
jgi:aminoglycoside phosphotransferase (APT) family kinase protein